MEQRKQQIAGVIVSIFTVFVILDSGTSLKGAEEGIHLCLKTVIPVLLPLFFLSGIISDCMIGQASAITAPIGKVCKIPKGAEPLFLMGLIGGYPVGAHAVGNAYCAGCISKKNAQRMLCFCNNPGPAFIMGIVASKLSDPIHGILLWIIIILSSVATGILLPGESSEVCRLPKQRKTNPMKRALISTATVCGWIVVFRVLLSFISKWVLPRCGIFTFTLISGILELTNGCLMLGEIHNEYLRFMLAAFLLCFGGICVIGQTITAAEELPIGKYIVGKLIQSGIALILSAVIGFFIFVS